MKKKTIAKETLVLFISILIIGLFFIGLYSYNILISRKISSLEETINANKTTFDSLNSISTLLVDNNSVYNFLNENNLTRKSIEEFLLAYSNPDSSRVIYNFMKINDLTDLTESNFIEKYFNRKNTEHFFYINNKIRELNSLLIKDIESRDLLLKDILTSVEIRRKLLSFSIILLLLVYPIRLSFYAIKWSISTLRRR